MINLFRFILAAYCILLCPALFAKNTQQALDGIVAVVNDSAVTQSELNNAANTMKAQLRGASAPMPSAKELQKRVLEQVVDRKLQLQAAAQAGIKISDKQVDETVENIAKQNGVSAETLYEKVASQNLTRGEYRKEIREELTLQQIQQQQVASKVNMTHEDVKNFMHSKEWLMAASTTQSSVKEYQVDDLIVLVSDTASANELALAKVQAENLLRQIKQGASYSSLINPDEKNLENNNLGWRKIDEMPSAFAEQIAAAKKGNVIGPIQTGNGFHIVRLIDIRNENNPAANATPAPSEKEAEQIVYQRKFAEVLKKWVAQLHSQAIIILHPDSV
ncbi:MAG TPA: SurA N-terminal domain-containing protein [Gammaproteobacteria bacterium]|nr:SurA N-terminal domain-containing protein [Gammaproteobacteria bacterium]